LLQARILHYVDSIMPKHAAHIILSLGANLTSAVGKPVATLAAAADMLKKQGVVIRAISEYYHTPAFPAGNGPDYVNAAIACSVEWSPTQTLDILHEIEDKMGRARTQRWGQRTLDIDMVAYDDLVFPNAVTYMHWRSLSLADQMKQTPPELILPHPRIQDRAFVLVPLFDIAPDWHHPVSGQTVRQMLDALPQADKDAVRAL
jgi:2-amino-4-hydroxy-6-hydroxymethyldihydropteridine diphosphokinase